MIAFGRQGLKPIVCVGLTSTQFRFHWRRWSNRCMIRHCWGRRSVAALRLWKGIAMCTTLSRLDCDLWQILNCWMSNSRDQRFKIERCSSQLSFLPYTVSYMYILLLRVHTARSKEWEFWLAMSWHASGSPPNTEDGVSDWKLLYYSSTTDRSPAQQTHLNSKFSLRKGFNYRYSK